MQKKGFGLIVIILLSFVLSKAEIPEDNGDSNVVTSTETVPGENEAFNTNGESESVSTQTPEELELPSSTELEPGKTSENEVVPSTTASNFNHELQEFLQTLRSDHEEYERKVSELVANNMVLISRVVALESRIRSMEGLLISISNDQKFHHPTMEVQYVDMQVVQWEQALKGRLRSLAIPFQAGFVIGAVSSWEFSLASENDAVTVNLLLIEEKYGKGALFAGFTVFVLDSEGNVFSQANALPVNFLDGNGRNLHLPNVITMKEIRNSSNTLLSDGDVFKIRLRLELIGVGHKLYPDMVGPSLQPPAKDVQTVVFDIENIRQRLAQENETSSQETTDKPIAFTKFILKHDVWDMDTEWGAEMHHGANRGKELSLHIILDKCIWPELYASLNVEVWDLLNRRLILTQGTPINDFVKDRINIDPLVFVSQLKTNPYEDDEEDFMLRFKMQFVIYGRNARYYADV